MSKDEAARRAFQAEIEEALELLREGAPDKAASEPELPALSLPSLLDQCRELIGAPQDNALPPLRSVHHLACTGGTLISRCIAALPGTQMLSEVDPLSPMAHRLPFRPTDVIGLAMCGSRPPDEETTLRMFHAAFEILYDNARHRGHDLILRDHAHSQFSFGPEIRPRPTLREILAERYPLRSVVTVRHPIDSFASLKKNRWVDFSPGTLEEYARRYLSFLDRHDGVEVLCYEDFVAAPEKIMQRIAEVLDLSYDSSFLQLFPAIRLSGDSGRRGDTIAPRPRRSLSADLIAQAADSPSYKALCDRLGYDTTPS
ncbi:hypothetical protein [Thalassovita aquimarina]|uniref:Sulfotransferase family protein n=1 Tax=Thalassovita aquimarina TaxID=2785917 RepID=A0ABS5HME9_9RHOB|nr:hypothetical protein [Thalassovita aquimarina]MBR9650062.1 sulfotransferase family protein [Thalassovita aquimarina]